MPAGTQTTTQQSNPKPYKKARPLIDAALADGMRAYQKGIGGQTYTGSTVIPFSNQTTGGMNDLMRMAGQNSGGQGLSGNMQNLINNGGFTDAQSRAMQGMEGLSNAPALNNLINGSGLTQDQTDVLGRWKGQATGNFDLNANPAYQDVLKNALESAGTGINAQAAAAGRYGSGANQSILAREQGKLASNMALGEYRDWQGRRDNANQNIANLSQTGTGNQMQAIGAKSGLQNTLFNAQQAGLANQSAAYDTMQAPARTAMGVGSMYEDLAKRQMDDQLRIFNDKQNQPWSQFARLMALANQTGAYGQNNTTTTQPGPNPFLAGLGTVTQGAGLLGGLFSGGSAGGYG